MNGPRHTTQRMNAPLSECPDRQFGFRWPVALDRRLDQLVERANGAGERTNRRELLAALLLNADFTGEELSQLVRTFRLATVGDAVLRAGGGADDNVIEFLHHRPGPRTS
jgi:hypothetical protein